MAITAFLPGIRYVGVNDRTTHLFEGLWSLPQGVSYNAYLVIGEKIALIDTVEEAFGSRLFQHIREEIGDRRIDYLVVNHMEPDHSSSIAALRQLYPDITIVGNAKTLHMIAGYYGICDGTLEVKEGDTLDLGGKTLTFQLVPMVHWPETMVTWCAEEQTLFSGDAFGTFGALDGGITDSQVEVDRYWNEMRRYYACIVGKYGAPVQKALQKVRTLPVATICPTHGPVWQRHIAEVIDLYDRMSRYEGEKGVVVAYASMYGNTEQTAERIARSLVEEGVEKIVVYNLSVADPSVVLRDVFRYDTLVVGSPTYNGELFPPVEQLLRRIETRCIPHRNFACFGSFTWAGAAVRRMKEFSERMKWEMIGTPVEMKQGYSQAVCEPCRALARDIAARMRETK
ncbi:FprA family A-type flavoprotein [uncultured Alistipes sp.]|uniref:FprA family A-type flavoprotein n=1 Tax=uncultured Alistipes sp. TaxID=538949 RepID=UPI00280437E6|nr:FprA family A-type flavoprotein [uncultured Alistipes sp.]